MTSSFWVFAGKHLFSIFKNNPGETQIKEYTNDRENSVFREKYQKSPGAVSGGSSQNIAKLTSCEDVVITEILQKVNHPPFLVFPHKSPCGATFPEGVI